jgi:hypothetical protein
MTTKTFYKLGEYYKNGSSGATRYKCEEMRGTIVAEGVVRISKYGDREEVVLEAELADTPKRAFDKLVAEKQLVVEEARLALEKAEKALKKAGTAHDDWLEYEAHEKAEAERRFELERARMNKQRESQYRDKP